MNIEFSVGSGKAAARQPDGSPTPLLFVGNFGGAKTKDPGDGAIRHMFGFDLLDVDTAIGRVQPAFQLDDNDDAATVSISSLEDFHPDSLFRRVPALSTFHEFKTIS